MKRLMMCLLLVLAGVTDLGAETVRLDIGEWSPYTSEKDPNGKIAEMIVAEALALSDMTPEFRYHPWKRSYENARTGKSAGTFPWYASEEKAKDFIFNKEPIITVKTVFFHLKSTAFDWKTHEDLKQYRIGIVRGYQEEKLFAQKGIPAQIVQEENLNFKKLVGGRIDATTGGLVVSTRMLNSMFPAETAAEIVPHPTPLFQGPAFMLISKQIPNGEEIAEKLDLGLKHLKASGRYREIMKAALAR